jgi:endonuclease III
MQESFDFAADDLAFISQCLSRVFGVLAPVERSDPVWKMVRSLIGCRTYDEVAESAWEGLRQRWPHPSILAAASTSDVTQAIRRVTYAEDKAANLIAALQWIGRERPDFDLSFLSTWPVYLALAWFERFPGVADKVAAATLNASTLRMRVFIVDSHVHRILIRFGFVGRNATPRHARDEVTAAALAFDADGLLELFAQMKRLGQTFCRPVNPNCQECPLRSRCAKIDWRPPLRSARTMLAIGLPAR